MCGDFWLDRVPRFHEEPDRRSASSRERSSVALPYRAARVRLPSPGARHPRPVLVPDGRATRRVALLAKPAVCESLPRRGFGWKTRAAGAAPRPHRPKPKPDDALKGAGTAGM